MPSQARSDLVPVSSSMLAFLTLIVADSNASPILQTLGSRGTGITSSDENLMSVKNILEWLFAGAAVIVVSAIFIWRVRFLRSRGRPLHDFFAFIEARPTEGGLPLNQQRMATTRAADIDSEGRRVGGPDPDDVNGNVTEKDVLPAYEVKGGPPNYNQVLDVDLGTGTNASSQITETLPAETIHQLQPVETGSGSTVPPTHPSPVSDVQLPRPPPPSHIPVTPTTHHTTPPAYP